MRMQHRFLLGLSLLLAALIPAGAAAQTAPKVSIGSNALLLGTSPFGGGNQLNVPLKVECSGGSGFVSVQVSQQRPPFGTQQGSGGESIPCTGQPDNVIVTVQAFTFPGFDVGQASAAATLSSPFGVAVDERNIHIVAR
jgi:hypothetical protein